ALLCLMASTPNGKAQTFPAPAKFQAIEDARQNRVLIMPKKGPGPDAVAKLHQDLGAKVHKIFQQLDDLEVIDAPPGLTVQDLLALYRNSGLVEWAEPDYLVQSSLTPNDPYYANGTLWGLNNTGKNGATVGADISAAKGWDVLNLATNVIVAVVDTG